MKLSPLPTYGDHMLLDDFVNVCIVHAFVNDDGTGYFATATEMSDIEAVPSEMLTVHNERRRRDARFTHVMWFNK